MGTYTRNFYEEEEISFIWFWMKTKERRRNLKCNLYLYRLISLNPWISFESLLQQLIYCAEFPDEQTVN